MSEDNQKPITKAEVDEELKKLFESLKQIEPVDMQTIKEKLAILKTMREAIND